MEKKKPSKVKKDSIIEAVCLFEFDDMCIDFDLKHRR